MNRFIRFLVLGCVALNLAACSAGNMDGFDANLADPAAYDGYDEFDGVEGTTPVLYDRQGQLCYRLEEVRGYAPDPQRRAKVFPNSGRGYWVSTQGEPCVSGMQVLWTSDGQYLRS